MNHNVPRVSCCLIFKEINAIAGPFYNIIKVIMKGPNKRSNLKLTKVRILFYCTGLLSRALNAYLL